ncbi:MAG: PD-(D/E)XK nuclease family protein [Dehalococcoidia bacterium]
MTDVYSALSEISQARRQDPLRPVTVIAPSHASALQLRRTLARSGPFAGVRFETLPRVAELLAAGFLAAEGRAPLARPIGDYLAEKIALDSGAGLSRIRDLPGYARVLRQIFARLRRAGVNKSVDVAARHPGTHLAEVLRLYDGFRIESAAFYDVEDLMDAATAALEAGRAGVLNDLGEVYVVAPGPLTAASRRLIQTLGRTGDEVHLLAEPEGDVTLRFRIAPEPASETADVVRAVIADLEAGLGIDEIAVFHGGDDAYPGLLREAFGRAGVPATPLPGVPLVGTRMGRAVLQLAGLPDKDYSRTAVMDFLSVAPIRRFIPADDGEVQSNVTSWDRASREAGITRGAELWTERLGRFEAEASREADALDSRGEEYAGRARFARYRSEDAAELVRVISAMIRRLEPLRREQPAETFIENFKLLVGEYLDGTGAYDAVLDEIDQLGTVGAVGGSFSLAKFTHALRANLESAHERTNKLGDGVAMAHYNVAAGMRFKRVYLCGAYEGAFPAGPRADALLDDRVWRGLKSEFPHIEDTETRIDRGREATRRAMMSGAGGIVTWSVPAYESGGGRDYYPSPEMVRAYNLNGDKRVTAADLRNGRLAQGAPLQRHTSPLASALRGSVLDAPELALRRAVLARQTDQLLTGTHGRARTLAMLRARWGQKFTEWDGHVGQGIEDVTGKSVSPTTLEKYAVCGFQYFASSVLYLRPVDEPEEVETLSPLERGTLIHEVLERFFRDQQGRGRPRVLEAWNEMDAQELMDLADQEFSEVKDRGLAGLRVYSEHDLRTIKADLTRFLEEDSKFRMETGAVPAEFEGYIPESHLAGVKLRGKYDRMDRTPDGERAWIIDYKTGSTAGFKDFQDDVFMGGKKLQLAMYGYDVPGASDVNALYWFISSKGNFERKGAAIGPEERRRLERIVDEIVGGVQQGVFPAVSGKYNDSFGTFDNCTYCDFNRICDLRREAAFERKKSDPAMMPWHNVGDTDQAAP